MALFSRKNAHRPQSPFIVVLLLLTLGLACLLALQAHQAARSHRAAVESTLRDYAAAAAWKFAGSVRSEFHWIFTTGLKPFGYPESFSPDDSMPTPYAFARSIKNLHKPPHIGRLVHSYFYLDLSSGRVLTSGPDDAAGCRDWVRDSLPAHAKALFDPSWTFAAVVRGPDESLDKGGASTKAGDAGQADAAMRAPASVGGQERERPRADWSHGGGEVAALPRYDSASGAPPEPPVTLVYTVDWDENETPKAIMGFELDTDPLQPIFANMVVMGSYLPPSLIGDMPTDSVMSITLTDPAGRVLYQSSMRYPHEFAAVDTVGTKYGGFQVHVALRPEVAKQLVIGGLPKSRLPLLLGLLAVTAGLVGMALLQHRREYELASLRAEFVSNVSHELRTPLAQIRMFAETLILGRVRSTEEGRRSLEIIDQEARRLTHLVENVLLFSRAERGAMRIAPEPTELAGLIREVVDGFLPLALARQVTVRTELREGLIACVDRNALRQIVLNLLDNAVKYGPTGQTVTVSTSVTNERVRIVVADQGPGIPPKERRRIWERFSRLDREEAAAVAGTGIGLAVVRELTVQHGGSTWVEGAPGGGARFIVELPGAIRDGGAGAVTTVAEAVAGAHVVEVGDGSPADAGRGNGSPLSEQAAANRARTEG